MKKKELIQKLLAKKASNMNGENNSAKPCIACCEGHCFFDIK